MNGTTPKYKITKELLEDLYYVKQMSKPEISKYLECGEKSVALKFDKFKLKGRTKSEIKQIKTKNDLNKLISRIPKDVLYDLNFNKKLQLKEIAPIFNIHIKKLRKLFRYYNLPLIKNVSGEKANWTKEKISLERRQLNALKQGNHNKQIKSKCYYVNNIRCQGTYEKRYIESLIKNNMLLPTKPKGIITDYGIYFPDFEFEDRYIEIKSEYTYQIAIGKIKGITNKKGLQIDKINWTRDYIKPVQIIIIDKEYVS